MRVFLCPKGLEPTAHRGGFFTPIRVLNDRPITGGKELSSQSNSPTALPSLSPPPTPPLTPLRLSPTQTPLSPLPAPRTASRMARSLKSPAAGRS